MESVGLSAHVEQRHGSRSSRGEIDTAVSLVVEDGRITRIYAVRNPHKLAGLDGVAALTRT